VVQIHKPLYSHIPRLIYGFAASIKAGKDPSHF
jgi:hypothetical protein